MSIESMREGINRANAGTPDHIKHLFDLAIEACAEHNEFVTSDTVRNRLTPVERMIEPYLLGLGPAFLRAAKLGVIEKTGDTAYSERTQHHRAMTVWRSKRQEVAA